jgi:AraC family transcriptional regulator of adaptative response/methylated-DNA-[protein]-cysteine methyltransferase
MKKNPHTVLYSTLIKTPAGDVLAVASDKVLYLLEFVHRRRVEHQIERLKKKTNFEIISGKPKPIQSIEKELAHYFKGKLKTFKTPLLMLGSPFQKQVWEALMNIPFGETCSYAELARAVKKPSAYRAAANANGANLLAIVIPCHRVINANGKLEAMEGEFLVSIG